MRWECWDFDQVINKWSPLARSRAAEKMMSQGGFGDFYFYAINREEAKRLRLTAASDGNGTSLWVGASCPQRDVSSAPISFGAHFLALSSSRLPTSALTQQSSD